MIVHVKRSDLSKWDTRFLELAEHIATWSKGPRKRIGAVIARPDNSIAATGYNGPPRGFDDEAFLAMSREEQHKVVVHAETNCIAHLQNDDAFELMYWKGDGFTMYVSPLYPCEKCAQEIVSAGIKRLVSYCGHISDDWMQSALEAEKVLNRASVECIWVKD